MSTTEDTRPFVAACRQLDTTAPLRWLQQGWQDFRQAPLLSVLNGFIPSCPYSCSNSTHE